MISLLLAGSVAMATASSAPVVTKPVDLILPSEIRGGGKNLIYNGITQGVNSQSNPLGIDFTAGEAGYGAVQCWSFDTGFEGWTPDQTQYVSWTTKKIKSGTDNDFARINPDDKKSLFVEGPYQTYKRECSSVTSQPVHVPAGARLSFWVGMTLNYETSCSLTLSVSDDGFETQTQLWTSATQQGEKPWCWRPITADLSNFAGKEVSLRFTYGPGTSDSFGTGGYMGDYSIDDVTVEAPQPVAHVSLQTGERVILTPLNAEGEELEYHWLMPGAVPAESNQKAPEIYYTADGDYDITLEVKEADGTVSSKTRTGYITVTGTAPVARILPPASFRLSSTGLPLVAPMVPVLYRDGSDGFPSESLWTFTGVDADSEETFSASGPEVEVEYAWLHKQAVGLTASNIHGSSDAFAEVSVEYEGIITNLRPDDTHTTFDMEDWGFFPGSNTRKITAYAEKFSKPSRPAVINGVYAYFTRTDAGQLIDQIASVGVHVYSSVNGLPGEKLESWWWQVTDLDGPGAGGELRGTAFPIDPPVTVDDEFFIVVDGIPEYSPATSEHGVTAVTLGMAGFRDSGNTTYMLKEGVWTDVSEYFPAGANHTSLMVYPSLIHSVIRHLPGTDRDLEVSHEAGETDYPLFSYMGWKEEVETGCHWARVTNAPGGMTVDNLHLEYDALPEGMTSRETTVRVTDGVTHHEFTLTQLRGSGINEVTESGPEHSYIRYNLDGTRLRGPVRGLHICNGRITPY